MDNILNKIINYRLKSRRYVETNIIDTLKKSIDNKNEDIYIALRYKIETRLLDNTFIISSAISSLLFGYNK